jgi:hypothetical protein
MDWTTHSKNNGHKQSSITKIVTSMSLGVFILSCLLLSSIWYGIYLFAVWLFT